MHRDHLHLCLYHPSGSRCQIRFEHGDITSPREKADLLIISAFRRNYEETPTSVIGALARKGLSVRRDVLPSRETLGSDDCWISAELDREAADAIGASRILCFEGYPTQNGTLSALQSLQAAVLGRAPHPGKTPWSIHMPLIGTGNMGADPVITLRLIVEAIQEAFATGLNIRSVSIFEYYNGKFQRLRETFQQLCAEYNPFTAESEPAIEHRLFISYSHDVKSLVDSVHQEITARIPRQHVFFDTSGSVNQGMVLSRDLARAVRRSRAMIAVITPNYLASPSCRVEFMTAYSRHFLRSDFVLKPFFFEVEPSTLRNLPREYRDVMGEVCANAEELASRIRAFVERLPPL